MPLLVFLQDDQQRVLSAQLSLRGPLDSLLSASEGLSRLWWLWCSVQHHFSLQSHGLGLIVLGNHDIIPLWAPSTLEMNLAPRTQQTLFGFICLCRWRNILGSDEEKYRGWGGEEWCFHTIPTTPQWFWIYYPNRRAEERRQYNFAVLWHDKAEAVLRMLTVPMRETPPHWENDSGTKGCNVIILSFPRKTKKILNLCEVPFSVWNKVTLFHHN